MCWDNVNIPMQPKSSLGDNWDEQIENELLFTQDPTTIDAERIQAIVDAKYTAADLEKIAKSCELLTIKEQEELLALLQKFEHLFDGQLGSWDSDPIEVELKDPNCKPYHAKPFPCLLYTSPSPRDRG